MCTARAPVANKEALEDLYAEYNRRSCVRPDPLQFVYDYEDKRDREIVGLIASSLAYGRVAQILKSVSTVLVRLKPTPYIFITQISRASLFGTFEGFKHRFSTGGELSSMLFGIKQVLERYGSMNVCFTAGLNNEDSTILTALSLFVRELTIVSDIPCGTLLPSPAGGSACKRLNLFLRWMVRQDRVDPGGWEQVPASKLIVPLDTHMHRICLALKLTSRRQADIRTAMEITDAFRSMVPDDPVRYDFALTRLGIRDGANLDAFLKKMAVQ